MNDKNESVIIELTVDEFHALHAAIGVAIDSKISSSLKKILEKTEYNFVDVAWEIEDRDRPMPTYNDKNLSVVDRLFNRIERLDWKSHEVGVHHG